MPVIELVQCARLTQVQVVWMNGYTSHISGRKFSHRISLSHLIVCVCGGGPFKLCKDGREAPVRGKQKHAPLRMDG